MVTVITHVCAIVVSRAGKLRLQVENRKKKNRKRSLLQYPSFTWPHKLLLTPLLLLLHSLLYRCSPSSSLPPSLPSPSYCPESTAHLFFYICEYQKRGLIPYFLLVFPRGRMAIHNPSGIAVIPLLMYEEQKASDSFCRTTLKGRSAQNKVFGHKGRKKRGNSWKNPATEKVVFQ